MSKENPTEFNEKELEITPKIKKVAKDFLLELFNSEKKIKSPVLEKAFRLSSPEVRAVARYLRRNGYPVGSSTAGYFYARDQKQWLGAVDFMRDKIISMLGTLREMKNCLKSRLYFRSLTLYINQTLINWTHGKFKRLHKNSRGLL